MKLLYNTHVFLQFALAEFQAEFFADSKQFIIPKQSPTPCSIESDAKVDFNFVL